MDITSEEEPATELSVDDTEKDDTLFSVTEDGELIGKLEEDDEEQS